MPEVKEKIKKWISNGLDKAYVLNAHRGEIKKYCDPQRKEIYETVDLTRKQQEQIDEIYLTNYGKKIPYTWHRHFTAFTGNFDPYYFPELLFIPEFEHFMNLEEPYNKVLADKNLLPFLAGGVLRFRRLISLRPAVCCGTRICGSAIGGQGRIFCTI